jgi:hypothetical protein
MVRYQIGHNFDYKLPGLSEASWWMQSMRQMDMGHFADNEEYHLPQSADGTPIEPHSGHGRNPTRHDVYRRAMDEAEGYYNALVRSGMPAEDARQVLPLACQHRLVWKLNATALKHALKARSCWIAQLGLWEPVIRGMVDELATKVHPLFRRLIAPPCVDLKTNEFRSCKYPIENADYIRGKDPHPPCALWLNKHREEAIAVWQGADKAAWMPDTPVYGERPVQLKVRGIDWIPYARGKLREQTEEIASKWDQMAALWGMNPSTWTPLDPLLWKETNYENHKNESGKRDSHSA